DLLYNEVVLREEQGEAPCLVEYVQRFGQFAGELQAVLEVHRALPEELPLSLASPAPTATTRAAFRTDDAGTWPTLPGYEILGMRGRGGMGVVYQARQVELDRLVALKLIRTGSGAGREERERFRREAEVAAQLQHPNIVQLFEFGEHDGCPYFALEL